MPPPTVYEALQQLIDAASRQPAPTRTLTKAIADARAVIAADSEKRSKRLKGRAGAKTVLDYVLIDELIGRNCSVAEIVAASGASATQIRVRRANLRGG